MYKQLPMIQVNQVRVPWLKSFECFTIPRANGCGSSTPDAKALAKIMKGNTAVGYYCKDEFNRDFAMDSETIKKAILGRKIYFFNLKLSEDKKLLHEPKGDRLGLDVPPEIFFNYENIDLGYRMFYDSKEKAVVLSSMKTKEYLKFRAYLWNNNRAWILNCYAGDLIDFSKFKRDCISEPVYRDMDVDCLDDFVKEMIKYSENSKAKKTTLEEDDSDYFETQWAKRHSLVDDYRHGCSQDSEEAYHTLNYLRKNHERYGKTWDI